MANEYCAAYYMFSGADEFFAQAQGLVLQSCMYSLEFNYLLLCAAEDGHKHSDYPATLSEVVR